MVREQLTNLQEEMKEIENKMWGPAGFKWGQIASKFTDQKSAKLYREHYYQ